MRKNIFSGAVIVAAMIAFTMPSSAYLSFDADTESETGTNTETQTTPNRNELICTSESETGSRIRRRVCRTQAQIDHEHEDARDFIERSRDHANRTRNTYPE